MKMGTFSHAIDNLVKVTYMELNCILQGIKRKCGLPKHAPLSTQKCNWMNQFRMKARSFLHSFLVCLSGLRNCYFARQPSMHLSIQQAQTVCPGSTFYHKLLSMAKFLCRVASNSLSSNCPYLLFLWKSHLSWTYILCTSSLPHGNLSSDSKYCIVYNSI